MNVQSTAPNKDVGDRKDLLVEGLRSDGVPTASGWVLVDQAMIDRFAEATLDPDPMHVSPDWAVTHSPFGGTIAFGFLTVGLLTHLLHSAIGSRSEDTSEVASHLNYGFDRLRLVEPVPVGSRVRGHFAISRVAEDERGRTFVTFACRIEIEGSERPALVADWLTVRVPHQSPTR